MSRPSAAVTVLKRPDLHQDVVRIEIGCRYGTTGLTQVPGPMLALTRRQMITAAVFAHEERCGRCDTEPAHAQGDPTMRGMTDRAWDELLATAQRRFDESRRN